MLPLSLPGGAGFDRRYWPSCWHAHLCNVCACVCVQSRRRHVSSIALIALPDTPHTLTRTHKYVHSACNTRSATSRARRRPRRKSNKSVFKSMLRTHARRTIRCRCHSLSHSGAHTHTNARMRMYMCVFAISLLRARALDGLWRRWRRWPRCGGAGVEWSVRRVSGVQLALRVCAIAFDGRAATAAAAECARRCRHVCANVLCRVVYLCVGVIIGTNGIAMHRRITIVVDDARMPSTIAADVRAAAVDVVCSLRCVGC